nr:RNA-directed DNA polymerase, eukaryota [Tanacetum cinerariifolium]
ETECMLLQFKLHLTLAATCDRDTILRLTIDLRDLIFDGYFNPVAVTLVIMGMYTTKEEDVAKISTSLFITNFSESTSAKELFNACKQYGHVVDTFSPTKRSKAGKRFGFVRFINVFSVERLVNNLCTVWIDRFKLHANVARFNRASANSHNHATQNVGRSKSNHNNTAMNDNVAKKDSQSNGLGRTYMHVVKGQVQSGIREEEMSPALVLDDNCLMSKDVSKCLLGRVEEFASLANLKMALYNEVIQASLDFVTKGRIAWVEIEGIPIKIWSDNTFKRIAAKWGELLDIDDHEETCFHSKRLCILTKDYRNDEDDDDQTNDQYDDEIKNGGINGQETGNGVNSDAEEVLETAVEEEGHEENNADKESLEKTGDKSEDPFNIYPLLNKNNDNGMNNNASVDSLKYPMVIHQLREARRVEVESDSICSGRFKKSKGPKTGGSILNLLDEVVKVRHAMGYKMDCCFEYVHSDSVGNSGGILCVWDPNSFSVYAPHDFKEKLLLWDYLNRSIGRWNGEVIIMGDFNEVRYKSDRFGTVFPTQGANAFNSFIYSAGLVEVSLGKLKHLKKKIREWNIKDKQRMSMDKDKYKVDLEALDTIIDQGDENTSFFHGVINKKRNLLNIRGIMVDGSWVDGPSMVKREFFNHFRNRFDKPDGICAITHMEYPRRISLNKQSELEGEVSNDEIKRAVWDCGTDKAPGPDGFTFGFYRRFWYLIDNDVYADVKHFFIHGEIPKGCNSSFIALIMKIPDANLVKDFRPISLIGSLYKIITKILANSDKWRMWIQSCLKSSRGSIIINGSPTEEFQFFQGFKQGDPLAPFLFILVMESLHLSFQRVEEAEMFKGIKIGPTVTLSHMFYADGAVFVGKWVIKAMYGDKGKIDAEVKIGSRSCWLNIVHEAKILTQKGITLRDVMRIKLGNGENTSFWEDCWIEGDSLRNRFPRLYTLESCKRITVGEKTRQPSLEFSFRRNTIGGVEQEQLGDLVTLMHDVSLSPMADRWTWALENSGEFIVSSVRKHIDDKLIPGVGSKTRFNVSRRGKHIDSIMCAVCDQGVETSRHLFFSCNMVRQTTRMITRWWDVSCEDFVDYDDWRTWIINLRLPSKNKMMLEGIDVMPRSVGMTVLKTRILFPCNC